MSTLIRFKRKKSTGNSDVKLRAGEPYYNSADKKLYVGNSTADDKEQEIPSSQLHIAQVTTDTADDATVKFHIGEAADNVFEKTINNVKKAKGLVLDKENFGTEEKKNSITNPEVGQVFFQEI